MKAESGRNREAPWVEERSGTQDQPQTSSRPRILVVDQHWEVRRVNAEVLIEFGYEVDTAEDGVAAWTDLQFNHYDLVVTSHDMPRVTGFELLNRMRAANMMQPVIFATEKMPRENFARLPWLQPALALMHPYTPDEFLETVKEVLRLTAKAGAHFSFEPNWQSQAVTDGREL